MGFFGDLIERMNAREDSERKQSFLDRLEDGKPARSAQEERFRERRDYNEWKRNSSYSDHPDIDEGYRG